MEELKKSRNDKNKLGNQANISENMRRKSIKFYTQNSTITFYVIRPYRFLHIYAPTVSEWNLE